MMNLFCENCKNFLKKTTHFSYCHTCSEIKYVQREVQDFIFIKPEAFGFLSMYFSSPLSMVHGLGFEEKSDLLQYFIEKREFFPDHIFNLNNDGLKIDYFNFLAGIRTRLSIDTDAMQTSDAYAIALIELKYILYGLEGRSEEIDPRTQGKYQQEFVESSKIVLSYLFGVQEHIDGLYFCDTCHTMGPREIMLNDNSIHPYDGCIWCSN
jgi:hypothetical protein